METREGAQTETKLRIYYLAQDIAKNKIVISEQSMDRSPVAMSFKTKRN